MKNKIKYYLAVLAVVVTALIGGVNSETLSDMMRELSRMSTEADREDDGQELAPLTVTVLDVGQGDSILLQCGDSNMLIDAGTNNVGTKLQSYFNSKGIKKFDYVVGTHPHSDHIGSLDVVITKFQTDHVLMPDESADTRIYDDVIQAMKYKSITPEHPQPGDVFYLGDAEVTVLGPVKKYNNTNNSSIVLMVRHGKRKFLFMGDAEEEAEKDILEMGEDVDADVLKMGHHGSSTSSCQEFLDAVSPTAAIISCGEGNKYGHPNAETMVKLMTMKIPFYRTDKEGVIVIESDGENLTFNVPPSEY